jgi:hypothetical protein
MKVRGFYELVLTAASVALMTLISVAIWPSGVRAAQASDPNVSAPANATEDDSKASDGAAKDGKTVESNGAPTTKLRIIVTGAVEKAAGNANADKSGKAGVDKPGVAGAEKPADASVDRPVGNASVYVRYVVDGGLLHHDKLAELDLKTNQDGSVKVPAIPQGKIMIQVVAAGWHTYGKWYDIDKSEEVIQIKLDAPPHWY